jgi:hypothetical protein
MNVPARLRPLIEKCKELDIASKFQKDINNCTHAIQAAEKVIVQWQEMQEVQEDDAVSVSTAKEVQPPEAVIVPTVEEAELIVREGIQTLQECQQSIRNLGIQIGNCDIAFYNEMESRITSMRSLLELLETYNNQLKMH